MSSFGSSSSVLDKSSFRSSAAFTRLWASLSNNGKNEWSLGTKNLRKRSIFMIINIILIYDLEYYFRIQVRRWYINEPTTADTGMVSNHAQKILVVTPHLTAETPFLAPAPIIAPVITCVVLTGIPKCVAVKRVMAPADSAQNPSNGLSLVIF